MSSWSCQSFGLTLIEMNQHESTTLSTFVCSGRVIDTHQCDDQFYLSGDIMLILQPSWTEQLSGF